MMGMGHYFRRSIGRRILAAVGVLGGLSLGGIGLFSIKQMEQRLLAQNENSLEQITELASQGIQTIMLAGYADIAHSYADNIKKVHGLLEFFIIRPDGFEAFRDNKTIKNVNTRLGEEEFDERAVEKSLQAVPAADPHLKQALESEKMVSFYETSPSGERLLGAVVPILNQKPCYRCHGGDHRVRGLLKLSTSLASVETVINQSRITILAVLITMITLFLVLLGLLLSRTVSRPMRGIMQAVDAMASGNLIDRMVVNTSGDEVAGIASNVNKMADSLAHNIRTINMHSGSITAFVQEILNLRIALDQDSVNLNTIAAAVARENGLLGQEIRSISGSITQATQTMEEITQSAGAVAEGIRHIAVAADEANGMVMTMASAAEEMTANVTEVKQSLEQVNAAASAVNTEVREMTESLEEVRSRCQKASVESTKALHFTGETHVVVQGLAASAKQIGEVSGLITAIASRTNILALNAAIEAAGAGEYGRGFAVVAAEVKDLANQTAAATRTIAERIEEIRRQVGGVSDAAANITGIVERINLVNQEIAEAVDEQARSIQRIAQSTGEVSIAAESVTLNARELEQSAHEVAQSAAHAASNTQAIAKASTVSAGAAVNMAEQSQTARALAHGVQDSATTTSRASQAVEAKVAESLHVVAYMQGSVRHFRSLGDVARNISDALHAAQSSLDIGPERFDIRSMKEVHLAMLGKLERAVNGSLQLRSDEITAVAGCPLTLWCHGERGQDIQDAELFQRMKHTHEQMHQTANEVIELLAMAKKPEAGNAVRFFHELRKTLFDQLNQLYMGETALRDEQGQWIIWSNELASGIAEVDREHQALVGLLNELHMALLHQETHSIGGILNRFVDHVGDHFAHEEALLQTRPGADYSGHQREHAYFLNRATDYQHRFRHDNQPLTMEVMDFLKNWLLRHIRGLDLRDLQG